MWNPYFTREAAAWYDTRNQHWPKQYFAGRDQAHRELPKKREQEAVLRRKARPNIGGAKEPVIAGLDPATQAITHRARGSVDPRVKPAGDDRRGQQTV